jgi:hypothetical protein
MELHQITETGSLFVSPSISDWTPITELTIDAIFNMDTEIDINIPTVINQSIYIYFPIEDMYLPDIRKLHSLARFGATLINTGHQLLCHCGMGHNRSALVAGLVLTYLGFSGAEAADLIRSKRKGALYNRRFANYLESVPAGDLKFTSKGPTPFFN